MERGGRGRGRGGERGGRRGGRGGARGRGGDRGGDRGGGRDVGRGGDGVRRGAGRGRGEGRPVAARSGGGVQYERQPPRPAGYGLIQEKIQNLTPDQMLMWLSADRGVAALLEKDVPYTRIISAISDAVRKAADMGRSPNLIELLIKLRDSTFFRSVPEFLESVPITTNRDQEDISAAVSSLMFLLNFYMDVLPTDSKSRVSVILVVIESTVLPNMALDREEVLTWMETIREKCQRQQQTIVEKKTARERRETDQEPPEDFRTISIFPTKEDFEKKPFLRENLIGQSYKNLETYLDVQFRLNREDFIKPLKDGIQDYKEGLKNGLEVGKLRNKDIKVYHGARFLYPTITPSGVIYTVQFSMEGLQRIRWENSKRLIFGSLVCFSADNFESFIFGVVRNRDPKALAEGKIDISLSTENNNEFEPDRAETFVMVESSAYFEAYRHVLKSLQDITKDTMPFQQYIVGERKDQADNIDSEAEEDDQEALIIPKVPRYLTVDQEYDLTPLMRPDCQQLGTRVKVMTNRWPPSDSMTFDESQLTAVKNALTRELSIVQGPPGTGKTFIGLKIAEVLLLNQEAWNKTMGPILVLCYTNHALDQFLEGILKFHNTDIVRVGSRSKNEELTNYNLTNLRRRMKQNREVPRDLRNNMSEIYRQMKSSEEEMISVTTKIEVTTKHVLSEKELANVIGKAYETLVEGYHQHTRWKFVEKKKKVDIMSEWLGIGRTVEVTGALQALDLNEVQEEEEAEVDIEEENIEVVGDAEHEENNRRLDIDGEQNDILTELKKKRAKVLDNIEIARSVGDEDDDEENPDDGARGDGGWEITKKERKRRAKKMKKMIQRELGKTSVFSQDEREWVEMILWDLTPEDRWKLYRTWVQDYVRHCEAVWRRCKDFYFGCAERLDEVKELETLHILRGAKVVGMTTTGAARLHSVLKNLNPSIMIVEEATEVLEAHIVASLTKSCQHLILIGDHQQLRPSPTVYELCRTYNLDVSLFERLIRSGVVYDRLDIQHRMLPTISRLLVPHIYQSLADHESVTKYPIMKGVGANMFFIDHNMKESEVHDGHSKVNEHEVEFLAELCRYLLKQNYLPSQITILTTYSGQLFALKKKMPRREFDGVKVSTVDNYQGEENDIILLSLVRSNTQNSIGFLAIDNRVCVALSRAKHALYCIGNFVQLCEKSELWRNIMKYVDNVKMCDRGLKLECQNHPEYSQLVTTGQEIRTQFPEGGCTKPCTARLECGHTCELSCHSYDPRHENYRCQKNCEKVCEYGHKCPKKCYKDCGPCQVKVQKIIPSCGHKQMVECSKDPEDFVCQEKCEKIRSCGHKCQLLCGVDCADQNSIPTRCQAKIQKKLDCGHTLTVKCYERDRFQVCRSPCEMSLDCGHKCGGTCGACHGARLHVPCSEVCGRPLQCGHVCRETCGLPCLCSQPCQTRCGHSHCTKSCAEPCQPCQEPCLRQCPHFRCPRLCSQPCEDRLCTEPCPQTLPCGHSCVGVCGEPCPNLCKICHKTQFDDLTEDLLFPCEPDDRFIQLTDCRHILPAKSMDQWVKVQAEEEAVKLLECPRCRAAVRSTVRYNRVINRSLEVVEKVKQRLRGEEESDVREKLIMEIKGLVTTEAKAVDNDKKPLYTEEEKKKLNEFKKGILQPELIFTVHHINNTKMVVRWMMVFSRLMVTIKREGLPVIEKDSTAHAAGLDLRKWSAEIINDIRKIENLIVSSLMTATLLNNQRKTDINSEVLRIRNYLQLLQFCRARDKRGQNFSLDMTRIIGEMLSLLRDISRPFTKKQEDTWKEKKAELQKKTGELGISDIERQEIVKALDMGRGAWYACPNGHPYLIDACHGAMTEGRCPDCGSAIGGSRHRLREDNNTFTEMDGSRREDYQWMRHRN